MNDSQNLTVESIIGVLLSQEGATVDERIRLSSWLRGLVVLLVGASLPLLILVFFLEELVTFLRATLS